MKQLDTDTVLTIIKMIEVRIKESEEDNLQDIDFAVGYESALKMLSNHLQDYIEGLVSQAEFNLNAGE